jgi:hypothetical protein
MTDIVGCACAQRALHDGMNEESGVLWLDLHPCYIR